jgi:riboflavin synthase
VPFQKQSTRGYYLHPLHSGEVVVEVVVEEEEEEKEEDDKLLYEC